MQICIILPYFGKLPDIFPFFLQSCYYNKNFDFLIFTDQDLKSHANVTVVNMPWENFVKHVQSKFDFPIALESPYKLCDFKPAYGHIFGDWLKKYDFWGHCDCDLIWGNLSPLIDFCEKGVDRIGEYGHLILYKNTNEVNNWFRLLKSVRVPSHRHVFSTAASFSFDAFAGMNVLVTENKKNTATPRLFDDIIFYSKTLFSRRNICRQRTSHRKAAFYKYNHGVLERYVDCGGVTC